MRVGRRSHIATATVFRTAKPVALQRRSGSRLQPGRSSSIPPCRTSAAPLLCFSLLLLTTTAFADPVKTANGLVEAPRRRISGSSRASPLRAAGRRPALEGAAAGAELERCQARARVRPAVHAAPRLQRHGVPRRGEERGLPLSERVDAGKERQRAAAGAGLLLRRRFHRRRRVGAAVRRRGDGAQGHRGADRQLPAGCVRLLRPPRADERSRRSGRPAIRDCSIRRRRCAGCGRTSPRSAATRRR